MHILDDTKIRVTGSGLIKSEPELKIFNYESGKKAKKCIFLCEFKGYKNKTSTFMFEVWDTAAIYIINNAKVGDIINFDAIPQNYFAGENKTRKTKFRIETFVIDNEKNTVS